MIVPGDPIQISDKKRAALGIEIANVIDDLENDSKDYFSAISIWWQNYEGTPRQKQKNFPFQNASNIIIPLIKMSADSRVATLWNQIFGAGSRVWQPKLENHNNEAMANSITRYINWQADNNDFDFRTAAYDWLLEQTVIGTSVLAGNWRTDIRHVHSFTGRGKSKKIQSTPIQWARGPILEHVPREQILWDTRAPSIQEAPAVVREFSLSWAQLIHRANADPDTWDLKAVEAIRGQTGRDGPSTAVAKIKDELDNHDRLAHQETDYDIREVTISWPLLNAMGIDNRDISTPRTQKIDTPQVDIVVTLHRKSRTILRLTAQPYFVPYKPFFDGYYHKRSGRGFSIGMAKILEQLQAGATTIFNQGIDAQTRANSIWGKTNIRSMVDAPIDPSKWIFDPTMKGVESLDLKGNDFSNIQLMQTLQAFTERISGQSDPAFGRETRLGGHSAPATTTLALLERGTTLTAPDRGLLTKTLGQAGEFIATLDQQFEDFDEEGKLLRVLGPKDAESAGEFLFPEEPIPGNYQFTIRGLSRAENPDAEIQQQLQVGQANSQYLSGIFSMGEALAKAEQISAQLQNPDLSTFYREMYVKGIQSATVTYKRFLNAADIDDVEQYALDLDDPDSPVAQSLAALRAGPGAPQGPGSPSQGPQPVESAGGPPSNGAAVPAGIPGGPQPI